jgi:hypothetical protein
MWLFLPDAFYSVRAYDSHKAGTNVDGPHVVVRARIQGDLERVRELTQGSFDLPHGSDYRYHLAVPSAEWTRFLARAVDDLKDRAPMKSADNPRNRTHMQVWSATWELEVLTNAR